MKHEEYQEMLAPHALGALDRADRGLMEEHLATCAECRTELDEWCSTAGNLACAADPVEPSMHVRERILETVRPERAAARAKSNVVGLASSSRRTVAWLPRFAAIAASLILVGLIVGVVVLWRQNRTAKNELATLAAETETTRRALQQDQKLLELLNSPAARVVRLTGTQPISAQALLVFDAKSGQAILRTNGLPQNAPGKAYQLWFLAGGAPMPGRVFKVEPTRKGTSADQVPAQALPSPIFAVTEENESGATAPTGPILLKSTS